MSSECCSCLNENNKAISCSGELESFNELLLDEKQAIISSCNLATAKSATKHDFRVCKQHLVNAVKDSRNRQRRRTCSIPGIVSSHPGINDISTKLHVGEKMRMKVFNVSGILLPMHTAYCPQCYKHLVDYGMDIDGKEERSDLEISKLGYGNIDLQQHNENTMKRTQIQINPAVTNKEETPAKRSRKNNVDSDFMYKNEMSQDSTSDDALSQGSVSSVANISKFDKLNQFMEIAGKSPLKTFSHTYSVASDTSKYRLKKQTKKCINAVLDTFSPCDTNGLHGSIYVKNEESVNPTLNTIVEVYNSSESKDHKTQILSILTTDKKFPDIQQLLPDVTRYQYNKAKTHGETSGVGKEYQKDTITKQNYSQEQVQHFVDYITSTDIMKDLPFGDKTLKMDNGEIITIPNVIRALSHSSIIADYSALCESKNFKPLGDRSLYKILAECSASHRKAIEGLDNFIMEGTNAFSQLEEQITKMQLASEEIALLKSRLAKGKKYLKSGLKNHISRESTCADHCVTYALSTGETGYTQNCQHQHTSICEDCQSLDMVLTDVAYKVKNYEWHNREASLYVVDEAIDAIRKWKGHVLRSWLQEQARAELFLGMTPSDAFITADWAMKFLPRKYREGQVDWFGKRGLNWHITVSLLKHGQDNETFCVTHIHVFDMPVKQSAAVTSLVLVDVARDILTHYKEVNNLHFFSDNAGCYKCPVTLLTLKSKLDGEVSSYNFSEAQNGKGPCDRRAANIKSVIRQYVNEGFDVTSATQMKHAVDKKKMKTVKMKVVSLLTNVDEDVPKKTSCCSIDKATKMNIKAKNTEVTQKSKRRKNDVDVRTDENKSYGKENVKPSTSKCVKTSDGSLPQISKLHNFKYDKDGVRFWKAYGVGEGQTKSWDNISLPAETCELLTIEDWEEINNVPDIKPSNQTRDHSRNIECPLEGCVKVFANQDAIDRHVSQGDCNYQPKKVKASELAKQIYCANVMLMYNENSSTSLNNEHCSLTSNLKSDSMPKGWAVKEIRQRTEFTEGQKVFIKKKFRIGQVTGNKVNPYTAAEEMRISGEFERKHFLSGKQIASYFSRLSQLEKNTNEADYEAALEEKANDKLKKSVLKSLQ